MSDPDRMMEEIEQGLADIRERSCFMGKHAKVKENRRAIRAELQDMSAREIVDVLPDEKLDDITAVLLSRLSGTQIADLLGDKGLIVRGENVVIANRDATTQAVAYAAYTQGRTAADKAANKNYENWIEPAHKLEVEIAVILNLVTGALALMYGRDMERQRVIATFERPAADLLDVLHRADIYNRRFQDAYGMRGIDLSQALGLRTLMAEALATAQNDKPVNAETLLTELRALRHPEIIDRVVIMREANKPGRKEGTAVAYIVEQAQELSKTYTTWRRRAEVMIKTLEELDYRTPAQEEALKTLREAQLIGNHGGYVRDTYHNARKKAASEGLTEAKNRVKLSTTPQDERLVLS